MFTHKTYRDHDANDLLSYVNRTDRPLRDQSGQEMSAEDIQTFLDKSESYEYEESWIYSPERGDEMSAEELSLAVRKTMREHLDDRQRASYCFSIHDDKQNTHAHIAAAGAKGDLRTDTDDLDRFRELGAEHTRERERARNRTQERDRQQSRDRDRAADDQNRTQGRER